MNCVMLVVVLLGISPLLYRTSAFEFHSDYEIARLVSRLNGDLDTFVTSLTMERLIGSRTHHLVRETIIDLLVDAKFTVRRHEFVRETPGLGMINFTNIMGISNPKARSFNAIACHYDTKYLPGETNLGVVDSLVSCVIILHLITAFKNEIHKLSKDRPAILVLFLDGNEPTLQNISKSDHLYGSTALANMMTREKFRGKPVYTSINMMTVLSLIGCSPMSFKMRYQQTSSEYNELMKAEARLVELNQLDNADRPYFSPVYAPTNHVDDHLPFLHIGVPILYLLPDALPQFRHSRNDNWSMIDKHSLKDFIRIYGLYLAESLDLQIIDEINKSFLLDVKRMSKTEHIEHNHPVIVVSGKGLP